jgi:hypothetical protein
MGLIPSNLRLLIYWHKRVGFESPVLTLGNQDVWATYDELKSFFTEMECPYQEPSVIIPHTSSHFTRYWPKADFVHAKVFFEMLGIRDYLDVDKFNQDKPMFRHDMNLPIPSELCDKFSLIVDSGTMEHVFDIRQFVSNVIQMSKVGGWVVHLNPLSSNYIDHGFYSFHPCFFFDFYELNGFDNLSCYILQVNPQDLFEKCPHFEYSYGMSFDDLIDPSRIIVVCFMAKKVKSVTQIQIPIQGIYDESRAKKASEIRAPETYSSLYESYISSRLQPFLKPVRPLLAHVRKAILPTPPRYKQLKRI